MNTSSAPKHPAKKISFRCGLVFIAVIASAVSVWGQGTITFNGAALFSGTNYYEMGAQLKVVIPTLGPHDGMAGVPAPFGPQNFPTNTSPYMVFFRQFSLDNFVSFNLTNGSTFGLISADLADPNSPSLSPVPITFLGFKTDGSTVTNFFTTPGGGATTFLNYTFTPAFASGLTSVDILATRWALDNLVFVVPEPSVISLIVFGLLVFAAHGIRARCGK